MDEKKIQQAEKLAELLVDHIRPLNKESFQCCCYAKQCYAKPSVILPGETWRTSKSLRKPLRESRAALFRILGCLPEGFTWWGIGGPRVFGDFLRVFILKNLRAKGCSVRVRWRYDWAVLKSETKERRRSHISALFMVVIFISQT